MNRILLRLNRVGHRPIASNGACKRALRNVLACFLFGCTSAVFGAAPIELSVADQKALQARIDDLIEKLGVSEYKVRESASRDLLAIGVAASAALEKAAASHANAEVRIRARNVATKIRASFAARPKVPPLDKSRLKGRIKVGGAITGKEVWTATNTYFVSADLIVQPRARLEIEPGTTVLVGNDVSIIVEPNAWLTAKSESPQSSILFAAAAEADGGQGYWGSLVGRGRIQFDNVEVRRSRGIEQQIEHSLYFKNVSIYSTKGDAIRLNAGAGGAPQENITIRDATGVGIGYPKSSHTAFNGLAISGVTIGVDGVKATPRLSRARIEYVKQAAVRANGGSPEIQDARLGHCAVGIEHDHQAHGVYSQVVIENATVAGIVVHNGSYPDLRDVTFEHMQVPGVTVTKNSYPKVGRLRAGAGFQSELLLVAPDSRIERDDHK